MVMVKEGEFLFFDVHKIMCHFVVDHYLESINLYPAGGVLYNVKYFRNRHGKVVRRLHVVKVVKVVSTHFKACTYNSQTERLF